MVSVLIMEVHVYSVTFACMFTVLSLEVQVLCEFGGFCADNGGECLQCWF